MKIGVSLFKSFTCIARKFLHDPIITMLLFPKVNQYPIQAVELKQNNNCLRSNLTFRSITILVQFTARAPKCTPLRLKSFPISLYIHVHTLPAQHLKFYVLHLFYWVDKITVVFILLCSF